MPLYNPETLVTTGASQTVYYLTDEDFGGDNIYTLNATQDATYFVTASILDPNIYIHPNTASQGKRIDIVYLPIEPIAETPICHIRSFLTQEVNLPEAYLYTGLQKRQVGIFTGNNSNYNPETNTGQVWQSTVKDWDKIPVVEGGGGGGNANFKLPQSTVMGSEETLDVNSYSMFMIGDIGLPSVTLPVLDYNGNGTTVVIFADQYLNSPVNIDMQDPYSPGDIVTLRTITAAKVLTFTWFDQDQTWYQIGEFTRTVQ